MQNISAKDFFTPTPFNQDTKNQIWMSQIADSHDNICNCHHPFAHLLASIFPPGHKDRGLTIDQILSRDYTEKCRSGGGAVGDSGLERPDIKEEQGEKDGQEEGYIEDAALEELIAAGESAATR